MAVRPYWLSFGASAISGLAPTFIQFRSTAGSTLAPPSITEPGSFGMYLFSYDPITQVAFICDGATTGIAFSDRYIQGVLDPFDQFGVTLVAIGNTCTALGMTSVALGTTAVALGTSLYAFGATSNALIGTTSSSIGSDSVDPTTVFGFLKRAQETREGEEIYLKDSGLLGIYSRGATATLLREKTITDSTTSTRSDN